MSQLVVRRIKANWQDRMRDYVVVVDGKEAGRVGNDAEARIEVGPGTHSLHLKIDWCRSPKVEFSTAAGEAVHFECGPNASPFLVLVYVTLWKNRYIWLRRLDPGIGPGKA